MRFKVVTHYLGFLTVILGLFMILPLVWSLISEEPCSGAFALSMGICFIVGMTCWRLVHVPDSKMRRREAILLVAGAWIMSSLFGSLPYIISGATGNFLDAFFESVSGFTTTGATIFTDIEAQQKGILLWRSLSQWLGGMGIITLFVALFPLLGIGAAHLVETEMPGPQEERLTPRIQDTAKSVWLLYTAFSFLEFVLLLIAGLGGYDALNVTLCTMPTGGFTPTNLSMISYANPAADIIVTVFMAIAGINFGLFYFLIWKRQLKQMITNPELRLYFIILAVAAILVSQDLIRNMGMPAADAIRHGAFQAVSITTTTGFSTEDFNLWPALSRSVLLILMMVGASAGSTGGALKVVRVLVLFKYAYRRILLAFNPRAVIPVKVAGKVLSEGIVTGIIGMAISYFILIIIGFIALSATGLDTQSALSSVLATLGNVGPGLGGVGPLENYQFIHPFGKTVLIALMLVGRLELFTILMLFTPGFWRWR